MHAYTEIASKQRRLATGGFTLLEIVLGMAILGLIVSGVYAVATGTVALSNSVSEAQNEEIRLHNFLRLLRRNFERLPGNAGITLMPVSGRGGAEETDVVFYDFPLAFHWPSVPAGSARVVLMSKASARGAMDVGLLYLNEEAEEDFRSQMGSSSQMPGLWLHLMSDVSLFEWSFYDETLGDRGEWVFEWEDSAKRPSIVRLNLRFYGQGLDEQIESIFWVPSMINPEQLVNGGGGARGAAGAGGAGAGAGGRGGRQETRPGGTRGGQGGNRGGAPPGTGGARPGGGGGR